MEGGECRGDWVGGGIACGWVGGLMGGWMGHYCCVYSLISEPTNRDHCGWRVGIKPLTRG